MSTENKSGGNWVAIITMMFIYGMISFVTNLAAPMGKVWLLQKGIDGSNMLGMMGNMMNFAAYLFMGIPAGRMLTKCGYKKTAMIGIATGFVGVGIQFLSGKVPFAADGSAIIPFCVYLLGAFICGFAVCMLNMVVNPMLNLLGGGGKVGTLMCMPAAKGLFHKAIIMSGTILNVNTKAMTEELGRAVVEQLGFGPDELDKLADVPYGDLVAAGQRAMAASIGTRSPGTPMMWGFGPAPDGEVLLQQPFQPDFASISDDVPLMIGTTFNELQRRVYDQPMTLEEARAMLEPTFGEDTEAYVEAFAEAWPDYIPQDLLSIDMMFRPKTIITADAVAETRQAPTYVYMWTWKSPVDQGSVHGNELNFCFNTLQFHKGALPEPTEADQALADNMARSWANFAATGDPNVEGLPAWQPYTAADGECFIFDRECSVRHNFDRHLEEIIDAHCSKQLDAFRASH